MPLIRPRLVAAYVPTHRPLFPPSCAIFFVNYAGYYPAYSKGEPRSLPFRLWQLRVAWLFLHARIFLHGFRVDGRSDLRRVRYLRVRRRC